MNPLNEHPGARKVVYTVFWILGLAIGATQVGYAAADLGQPVWLTVALAVFAFVAAGIGFTAAANTDTGVAPRRAAD